MNISVYVKCRINTDRHVLDASSLMKWLICTNMCVYSRDICISNVIHSCEVLIEIVNCYILARVISNFSLHRAFEPACELCRSGLSSIRAWPEGLGLAWSTFEPSRARAEPYRARAEPRASSFVSTPTCHPLDCFARSQWSCCARLHNKSSPPKSNLPTRT